MGNAESSANDIPTEETTRVGASSLARSALDPAQVARMAMSAFFASEIVHRQVGERVPCRGRGTGGGQCAIEDESRIHIMGKPFRIRNVFSTTVTPSDAQILLLEDASDACRFVMVLSHARNRLERRLTMTPRGWLPGMHNLLTILQPRVQTISHHRGRPVNVHAGVWDYLSDMWASPRERGNVKHALEEIAAECAARGETAHLDLVGVSMGGMMAQLVAFRILEELGGAIDLQHDVFVFGTPRVANSAFYRMMASRGVRFAGVCTSGPCEGGGRLLDPVIAFNATHGDASDPLTSLPTFAIVVDGPEGPGVFSVDPGVLSERTTSLRTLTRDGLMHVRKVSYAPQASALLHTSRHGKSGHGDGPAWLTSK